MATVYPIVPGVDFKGIDGFPPFCVGSDGSAWKFRRATGEWYRIRQYKDRDGYLSVAIRYKGKQRRFLVHRLVLMAFCGPCPDGMQARHMNGCSCDNRIKNLKWGTTAENQADKNRHNVLRRSF